MLHNKSQLIAFTVDSFKGLPSEPRKAWLYDLSKSLGVEMGTPVAPAPEQVYEPPDPSITGASLSGPQPDLLRGRRSAVEATTYQPPPGAPTVDPRSRPAEPPQQFDMNEMERRMESIIQRVVPATVSQYVDSAMQKVEKAYPQQEAAPQRPPFTSFGYKTPAGPSGFRR